MDWTQALTIILSMIAITFGAFFFLNNKIDVLSKEIQNVRTDLTKEINLVKMEVLWIKFRLDPNEHPKWNQTDHKEIE